MNATSETNSQPENPETNTQQENNTNESQKTTQPDLNPMLVMLEKMKPLATDFMKQIQKNVSESYKENTSGTTSAPPEQVSNDKSNNDSGESSDVESGESVESDSGANMNQAINSVFGMLKTMFENIDKYKGREYLAFIPKLFEALSGVNPQENSNSEFAENVKINASKLCDMLKGTDILDLYENPEFKSCVLALAINFNRLAIEAVKNQVAKMEEEVNQFNETTSIDILLQNIYDKFNKNKK